MGKETFVQYLHKYSGGGEQLVFVNRNLIGFHRNACLCFCCEKFKPGTPDNCPIAQANYELCVKYSTVQPVMECPVFEYSAAVEAESAKRGA